MLIITTHDILTLCIVVTCHHHVITFIVSVARVQGHHHFAPQDIRLPNGWRMDQASHPSLEVVPHLCSCRPASHGERATRLSSALSTGHTATYRK